MKDIPLDNETWTNTSLLSTHSFQSFLHGSINSGGKKYNDSLVSDITLGPVQPARLSKSPGWGSS